MFSSEKRSHSPTPALRSKRLKASDSPDREGEPSTELRQARALNTRGSQWFPLDTTRLDRSTLNDLVLSSSQKLKEVGKRPLFPPKVFPDGFAIDWLLDFSVQAEDTKRVLAVGGISKASIENVLSRVSGRSLPRSAHEVSQIIDLTSENDPAQQASGSTPFSSGLHIGDPICVDDLPETLLTGDIKRNHTPQMHSASVRESFTDDATKLDELIDSALSPLFTIGRASEGSGLSDDGAQATRRAVSEMLFPGDGADFGNIAARSMSTPVVSSQRVANDEHRQPATLPLTPSGHSRASTRQMLVDRAEVTVGSSSNHNGLASTSQIADRSSDTLQEISSQVDGEESPTEDELSSESEEDVDMTAARPTQRTSVSAESHSRKIQDTARFLARPRPVVNGRDINVPKTNHARGRRLLVPTDSRLPYAAVAMRGDAQFIDRKSLAWMSQLSLPTASAMHVEDCCLLGGNIICVGYDTRPCQISLLPLTVDERPVRYDLAHRAHSTVYENPSTGTSQPNPGVSCLAPVDGDALRFVSGGHDKTVHLWTVERRRSGYSARSERLNISHPRSVHALAYRAFDETIYSCSGPCIFTAKLSEHRMPDPTGISSSVLQVHVHPQAPHLVVLEVRHMDRQIQLYDTRKGGFARAPCLEWGYRDNIHRRSGRKLHTPTRYTKGSTYLSYFGRGYADGTVCVWDFRKPSNVMTSFQCQRDTEVVHTVLADSGSTVVAYGRHSVSVYSLRGDRA